MFIAIFKLFGASIYRICKISLAHLTIIDILRIRVLTYAFQRATVCPDKSTRFPWPMAFHHLIYYHIDVPQSNRYEMSSKMSLLKILLEIHRVRFDGFSWIGKTVTWARLLFKIFISWYDMSCPRKVVPKLYIIYCIFT